MAPVKFGLFKGRSREYQDQPSTENLIHHSNSTDIQHSNSTELVVSPPSPIPSTSRGYHDDYNGFSEFALLNLDSDDEDESEKLPSVPSPQETETKDEETQINYKPLPSTNATSTTTLDMQDDPTDSQILDKVELATPDDATSVDAYSLQFDETSIYSEEVKYSGPTKKQRKTMAKEEQKLKDRDMWKATDFEVMQHLLSRGGTLDEQIKWEAIATARGLCTLRAACVCADCSERRCPPAVSDGDAGLGAAPLIGAVSVGCVVQ